MKWLVLILVLGVFACNTKSVDEYLGEAEKFEEQGQYEKAIKILDEAVEGYPEHIAAYINRGADKAALGEYEEAIMDYDKALELEADNIMALFNRGNSKQELEDHAGAIQDYSLAVELKGGAHGLTFEPVYNEFLDNEDALYNVEMGSILYNRGVSKLFMESGGHCEDLIAAKERGVLGPHNNEQGMKDYCNK